MISHFLLFLAVCLLIPLACVLYVWGRIEWKCRKKHSKLRELPTGLPTLPLLGHLHHILFTKEDVMTAFIGTLRKAVIISKGTFCFWIGPAPLVFINNYEDIQVILNGSKTLGKAKEYDLFKFAAGDGLLTAPVTIWKITRRHVNGLFYPRNLETLVPFFNKNSRELVQKLSTKTNTTFDIFDDIYGRSMINLYGLIFGPQVQVDVDSEGFKHIVAVLHKAGKLMSYRLFRPWLQFERIFQFLQSGDIKAIDEFCSCLSDSAFKVIELNEEKLKTHKAQPKKSYDAHYEYEDRLMGETPNSTVRDPSNVSTTLPEVYRVMRQNHPQFTADDLQNEIKTLFSAGTDTTAVTLSSCLVALGRHTNIQEKLYDEILVKLGSQRSEVTSEDVRKLTYMDCVLKETIRRFSIVPLLLRRNEEELKLSDCTLPARTTIAVSIMGLNMNPREFPDPERFDPERFTADNAETRKRYSFIPFSGGRRDCIGKQYAWLNMKITLVHLLREYKFSSNVDINKMRFSFEILLVSMDGYHVSFEKRQ